MRSIGPALAWEIFKPGWPHILMGFLGGLAFPLFILLALKAKGALIVEDPAMIIIQTVFFNINGMIFASGIFYILGKPKRLFCLPITNFGIALSQMVPTFVLMVVQVALYTTILNSFFPLGWHWLGPAIFIGTAVVTFQAVLWISHNSLWVVPLSMAALLVECFWFKSRFGPVFGMVDRYWMEVTFLDWMTMGLVLTGAFFVGWLGISWNRCGDPLNTHLLEKWFVRLFETGPGAIPRLDNPEAARFWSEWRQKGWFFPMAVLMSFLICLFVWALADRNPENLFHAMFIGGFCLGPVGFIAGLLFGNFGSSDASNDMGHFLASRPMTSKSMAQTTIRVAMISLGLSWVIWATAILVVYAAMALFGFSPSQKTIEEMKWWYLPATLLLPWMCCGGAILVSMPGRGLFAFFWVFGAYIFYLVGALSLSMIFDPPVADVFHAGCFFLFGLVLIAGTAWAFYRARKLDFISSKGTIASIGCWVLLAVIVTIALAPQNLSAFFGVFLPVGLLTLAVAPFAGAPLALAWNRAR